MAAPIGDAGRGARKIQMLRRDRKLPQYMLAAVFLTFLALAATSFAPSAEARLDGGYHHESNHGDKNAYSFWAHIVKAVKVFILHHSIGLGGSGPSHTCS
jgi:hypothetical protein